MTLEEFIADCRRQRDERNTERDGRFNFVVTDVIRRFNQLVPAPIRPFIAFTGARPTEDQLRRYPRDYAPTEFGIVGAPGLATINFIVVSGTQIQGITVRGEFSPDFIEAAARASDPQ